MTFDVARINASPDIEAGRLPVQRLADLHAGDTGRQMRHGYFSAYEELGQSLAGRQRMRVPGAAPRDAEIPEELASHRAFRAARAGSSQ